MRGMHGVLCNVPKRALQIVDTRQAYNAVIDEEKCIHCGICTNVCQNNKETTLKHPETWYQGWIEDEKLRRKSSSGGAAKAILFLPFSTNGSQYILSVGTKSGFQI